MEQGVTIISAFIDTVHKKTLNFVDSSLLCLPTNLWKMTNVVYLSWFCFQLHNYVATAFVLVNMEYHILLINSCGYYKFQVEIGTATNQDFNIKIVCKA